MTKEMPLPSAGFAMRILSASEDMDAALLEAFEVLDEAVALLERWLPDADPLGFDANVPVVDTRAFLTKVRR